MRAKTMNTQGKHDMKKRHLISIIIVVVVIAVLIAAYAVTTIVAHKQATRTARYVIKQIEQRYPTDIDAIYYRRISVTPLSLVNHSATFKDVIVDIKSLPDPLLMQSVYVKLTPPADNQEVGDFQIRATGVHFKSLKDTVSQVLRDHKKTVPQQMDLWSDNVNPQLAFTLNYHAAKHTMQLDYRIYQGKTEYAHVNALLKQVTFSKQQPLSEAHVEQTLHKAIIVTSQGRWHIPIYLSAAALEASAPNVANTLKALAYHGVGLLVELQGSYQDHHSQGVLTIQLHKGGTLTIRQNTTHVGPLHLLIPFCQTQQCHKMPLAVKLGMLTQQYSRMTQINTLIIHYQDDGLANSVLQYFAEHTGKKPEQLQHAVVQGIDAIAMSQSVPALNNAVSAIAKFVEAPDNLTVSLLPKRPITQDTFMSFAGRLAETHNAFSAQVKAQKTEKAQQALLLQYQQARAKLIQNFLTEIGFNITANIPNHTDQTGS